MNKNNSIEIQDVMNIKTEIFINSIPSRMGSKNLFTRQIELESFIANGDKDRRIKQLRTYPLNKAKDE
jgi:hypothetical protein